MKNLVLAALVTLFLAGPISAAVTSEVVVLQQTELTKLSNDELLETYIETLAEVEAIRAYHGAIGMSAGEYAEYKDLVKYRLRLLMEIHTRNIALPPQLDA
jgi:hypothetical protein